MSLLSEMKCEVCRVGAPPVKAEELGDFVREHPGWEAVKVDGVLQLQRTFLFADFVAPLAFAQRVGNLAEAEGHHPALLIEWGRVTVRWWTHKIKNLHRNDLIMAAKTDALAGQERR